MITPPADRAFDFKIPGYSIVDVVGPGEMAAVYRAREVKTGRWVALKIVSPRFATSPQFEAVAGASLQAQRLTPHPNIVEILDHGSYKNRYFIVMELLDASLRDVLDQRHKLPFPVAAKILQHLLLGYIELGFAALARANRRLASPPHYYFQEGGSQKIDTLPQHHLAVKPANILLGYKKGIAKMGDFGLKQARHSVLLDDSRPIQITLEYFSPEQAHGERTDERTDLFALGVVFYECLMGHNPLLGENLWTTYCNCREGVIPKVQDPEGLVPSLVVQVVERLTAPNPKHRYASAAEALSALGPLVDVVDRDTPTLLEKYFADLNRALPNRC